ncbi:MAG: DNA alkylation repair protein [Pseudomonadota bacterium]
MSKALDIYLAEVTERTEALARQPTAPSMKSKDVYRLKIIVPKLRKAVKQKYSFVSESTEKKLKIWDYIWHHSAYYDVMSQALYFYQHRDLTRVEVDTIIQWIERCDCWEHSDDLSKIYATVVEANPDWIMPTLKEWNQSENAWKRRQSMVSLLEYSRKRKRVLPYQELIAFVEPRLDDEEYYVQKGVGWTLREIYNVYPDETKQFIEKHVLRIPPQGWTAATEKFDKAYKAKLMALRKARPKSRRA